MLKLKPHPSSRPRAVTSIAVELTRLAARQLALTFEATGDFRHLVWPVEHRSRRTEGLWRHTCFEAFVRSAGDDNYFEFNLSPSREWAAWRFTGYREGMKEELRVPDPRIGNRYLDGPRRLSATLDMDRLTELRTDVSLFVGLSAVIEERDGGLSYWALEHAGETPDFHHPDCFRIELQPASRT